MVDRGLCVCGGRGAFMVGEIARVTGNEQGTLEDERKNRMTRVE